MLRRRIRGVLTSALIWAGLSGIGGAVAISIMVLTGPHASLRELWSELVDIIPGFYGYAAALGGLIALVVAIAEPSANIDRLSSWRFRFWGLVAGALAFIVLGGAYTGAQGASLMLRVARHSRRKLQA